jgi:hypothetical protein
VEDPVDISILRAYCFWYQETKCSWVASLNNCEDRLLDDFIVARGDNYL